VACDGGVSVLFPSGPHATVCQVTDGEVTGGGGRVARRGGGHWVAVVCTCGEVRGEAVATRCIAWARWRLITGVLGPRVGWGEVGSSPMVPTRAVGTHGPGGGRVGPIPGTREHPTVCLSDSRDLIHQRFKSC